MTTHHQMGSVDALRQIVRNDPRNFIDGFYMRLFTAHPDLRALFPASLVHQRAAFARALDHVLTAAVEADDPNEMVDFLAQLGRGHRKYGVTDEHLIWATQALVAEGAARLGEKWDSSYLDQMIKTLALATGVMRGGLAETTGSPWWSARVVSKEVIARDITVVRLITDTPLTYRAGQSLDVSIPQWPRSWRVFSPATPPNSNGELEFHVKALDGGMISRSILVDTRPGDVWKLAAANGDMVMYEGCSTVMVAGGCGLAPLRAMLMDLVARGIQPPNTTLFYAARCPGELFDLQHLRALAAGRPWLTVVAVTETRDDPWWVDSLPSPAELGLDWVDGVAVDAVLDWENAHGRWMDTRYLISGPPSMVANTRHKLMLAGVSADRISNDHIEDPACTDYQAAQANIPYPPSVPKPPDYPARSMPAPGMASMSVRV